MAKKASRNCGSKDAPIVYPTCVRHAQPRKDVKLRHFFLSDSCTRQWVQEAFGGNEPCQGNRI